MKNHLKVISSPANTGQQTTLLAVQSMRKTFQSSDNYLNVLENIDFSIKRGEMVCLLGRSGCGKTTLLNILAGFIPPTSGQILLDGQAVTRPGPDRCVVFQEDVLFPWLTVEENIGFGMQGNKKGIREEVRRFLSLVGLSEFHNYLPKEISGGMKQRVALARVLIRQPAVLLMDEPFASLDAQTREEMQNLLLALWGKLSHTILFVTHDVQEAVNLADRILLMGKNPGRIREDIPIDIPRPRTKNVADFLDMCQQLFEKLRATA